MEMTGIPLLLTVHEVNGRPEVVLEPARPEDSERLLRTLDTGHWLVIVARVFAVTREGGFERGEKPPGLELPFNMSSESVTPRVKIQLDTAGIFMHPTYEFCLWSAELCGGDSMALSGRGKVVEGESK